MKVPSVIIGLTIVAMGTSAPEASVSINAALTGNNDIAISNVVGSNIFNGLVVVGICAFLASFKTNLDILKRDMPLNIVITMILCFMFMDGKLSRIEGLILLAGMAAYIVSMIYSALKIVKLVRIVRHCRCQKVLCLWQAVLWQLFLVGILWWIMPV